MTNYRWRKDAKALLFDYSTNMLLLARQEQDIIHGQGSNSARDHQYRRGGVTNPTLMKAQKLDEPTVAALRKKVTAVQKLITSFSRSRRVDMDKLRLLNMVYFRASHSLLGASVMLEISDRTAKRWNTQSLEFLAREMGWLE